MHNLSLVELTACYILTTERTGGGQEKVMRLLAEAMPAVHTQKEATERTGQYSLTSVGRKYEPRTIKNNISQDPLNDHKWDRLQLLKAECHEVDIL
jgi:hypothetical protein